MDQIDQKVRHYLAEKLKSHEELLPTHMRDGMRLYVLERVPPGGFLEAVLSNDLKSAIIRADSTNQKAIVQIVQFCMWALPIGCWGSPERVTKWLNGDHDIYG
jgi:hypothetical protein